MTHFSQEIIDLICDHLGSIPDETANKGFTKLWPYSGVSRQWKAAVERKTFGSLSIIIDDADEFVGKVNSDKARYVREVHLHVMSTFPQPLEEDEAARYPRYADDGVHVCAPECQAIVLANLTTVIKHMAKWEGGCPIFFSISGTYLRLSEKSILRLPILKNITAFSCIVQNMDPFDSCKLATRMPELRKFRFAIQHHAKEQRSDLADEIGALGEKLPHLESLEILGDYRVQLRQSPLYYPRDDMRNEAGVDRLCQELRLLSQKRGFKHLRMEHFPISRELFEDTLNAEAKMSWPTLEEFMLLPHEISSTGEWFLLEDHGRGTRDEMKGFRYMPDDVTADPITQLFLRAISSESSPAMKRAGLGFRVEVPFGDDYNGVYKLLASSRGKEIAGEGNLKGEEDMDALFNFQIRNGSD